MPPSKKTVMKYARGGDVALRTALQVAEPRPTSSSSTSDKITYATRFADAVADEIARDLTPLFPDIEASTKRSAPSSRGKKQLDINFSTPKLGLALGVSLKSVHIREAGGRYTHNIKRNDEELATEASVYHERQPWAVLVAVVFLPFDACSDGKTGPSSFGTWVKGLRHRVGRVSPGDRESLFEKGYIALYNPDGTDLRFFDIQAAPPKQGEPPRDGVIESGKVPNRLLAYDEFMADVYEAYQSRNHTEFRWADGSNELLTPDG